MFLFQNLRLFICIADGPTSGAESYSGWIGGAITESGGQKRTKMVNFEPVRGLVERIPIEFLDNTDVKHMYHYCLIIQEGPNCDQDLKEWFDAKPGHVTPARWVTTASNILVFYMQTPPKNVTPELKLLVKYIVRVYAPCLLSIKQNWAFRNGPIHLFNLLMLSKKLLSKKHPTLYKRVTDTIQNNAFFANMENILVTMCHDQDPKINEKAISIIDFLRKQEQPKIPRKFKVPQINFDAEFYYDLINLDNFDAADFTSPPILSTHSIDDLKNKEFKDDYLKICCHSQHVERAVSLVSEAALHAIGQERRHAWIINKTQVCEELKTNFKKSDYYGLVASLQN